MGQALKKDLVAKKINRLHRSVTTYKKLTFEAMVECGKLLYEEKWKRPGHFLFWLQNNIEFSERTAHKYMRVYRLSKSDLWDKEKTVAENLAYLAEPQTFKQCVNQSRAEDLAFKKKIPLTSAKKLVSVMDKLPEVHTVIKVVNTLTDEKKSKIRIKLFEALERAYDLGRRNKLLTIKEKRDLLDVLLGVIEK